MAGLLKRGLSSKLGSVSSHDLRSHERSHTLTTTLPTLPLPSSSISSRSSKGSTTATTTTTSSSEKKTCTCVWKFVKQKAQLKSISKKSRKISDMDACLILGRLREVPPSSIRKDDAAIVHFLRQKSVKEMKVILQGINCDVHKVSSKQLNPPSQSRPPPHSIHPPSSSMIDRSLELDSSADERSTGRGYSGSPRRPLLIDSATEPVRSPVVVRSKTTTIPRASIMTIAARAKASARDLSSGVSDDDDDEDTEREDDLLVSAGATSSGGDEDESISYFIDDAHMVAATSASASRTATAGRSGTFESMEEALLVHEDSVLDSADRTPAGAISSDARGSDAGSLEHSDSELVIHSTPVPAARPMLPHPTSGSSNSSSGSSLSMSPPFGSALALTTGFITPSSVSGTPGASVTPSMGTPVSTSSATTTTTRPSMIEGILHRMKGMTSFSSRNLLSTHTPSISTPGAISGSSSGAGITAGANGGGGVSVSTTDLREPSESGEPLSNWDLTLADSGFQDSSSSSAARTRSQSQTSVLRGTPTMIQPSPATDKKSVTSLLKLGTSKGKSRVFPSVLRSKSSAASKKRRRRSSGGSMELSRAATVAVSTEVPSPREIRSSAAGIITRGELECSHPLLNLLFTGEHMNGPAILKAQQMIHHLSVEVDTVTTEDRPTLLMPSESHNEDDELDVLRPPEQMPKKPELKITVSERSPVVIVKAKQKMAKSRGKSTTTTTTKKKRRSMSGFKSPLMLEESTTSPVNPSDVLSMRNLAAPLEHSADSKELSLDMTPPNYSDYRSRTPDTASSDKTEPGIRPGSTGASGSHIRQPPVSQSPGSRHGPSLDKPSGILAVSAGTVTPIDDDLGAIEEETGGIILRHPHKVMAHRRDPYADAQHACSDDEDAEGDDIMGPTTSEGGKTVTSTSASSYTGSSSQSDSETEEKISECIAIDFKSDRSVKKPRVFDKRAERKVRVPQRRKIRGWQSASKPSDGSPIESASETFGLTITRSSKKHVQFDLTRTSDGLVTLDGGFGAMSDSGTPSTILTMTTMGAPTDGEWSSMLAVSEDDGDPDSDSYDESFQGKSTIRDLHFPDLEEITEVRSPEPSGMESSAVSVSSWQRQKLPERPKMTRSAIEKRKRLARQKSDSDMLRLANTMGRLSVSFAPSESLFSRKIDDAQIHPHFRPRRDSDESDVFTPRGSESDDWIPVSF